MNISKVIVDPGNGEVLLTEQISKEEHMTYGGTSTADLGDWLMMFTLNLVPDKREFMLYSIQSLKKLKPDWFQ